MPHLRLNYCKPDLASRTHAMRLGRQLGWGRVAATHPRRTVVASGKARAPILRPASNIGDTADAGGQFSPGTK